MTVASPDYSDGCMIALYPPQSLAEDLAVPDGLDPAEMHVTVAYLGNTADVDRDGLLKATQALAARTPIEASVSGHARFTGGDKDVIVALVDSPALEDLRRDTLDQLATHGIDIPRDHGYTPHMSITYVDPDAESPVGRIDTQPVAFGAISAVYGTERINFPILSTESAPFRIAAEHATLQLRDLKGIWRPVYARRQALHTTADAIVLAAWKTDLHGIDLAPAIAAWRQAVGETIDPATQKRRQAAAAAILGTLAARPFTRTRTALVTAAQRAHRAGWAAGHALVTRDASDASDYDDPEEAFRIGSQDMTDHAADATAASALSAALRASANRAGRAMADSADDPADDAEDDSDGDGEEDGGDEDAANDAEDVLDDGYDLALATDVAVSAAYGAGMLSAYIDAGASSVSWATAGDGTVCVSCVNAEDNSPYSLLAAPRMPLHPSCRCCLIPE
ncbi:2'-5' RNA ligase family protein [Streptomyces sp. NPDC057910]|uniref:2'-5' RNA ligase family protein n=1 Tax=Streptomyces sp. NPDC057910 TaxID=3346278 RepID=UPI0036E2731F